MAAQKLRFGILGCARIVRRAIAEGFKRSAAAQWVAIASRSGETAAAWAQEYGIPRHYGSYEALLEDRDVDAVYIPLPNDMHAAWTLRGAAAGKHVLCEKPLGLDAADAQRIVAGCRERGVLLMEAFMWRHHPRITRARELLAEGKLGELRLVKMDFSFDMEEDRREWMLEPARGGGALLDIGCYGINAARLFTGTEPVEVHARSRFHPSGVDLTTAISLRFTNDVLALADCSFECPYRNRIEIVGATGELELPEGVLPPPECELIFRDAMGTRVERFSPADQYAAEIDDFVAAVAAGRLLAPAEDGLANMLVVDAAGRSAREAHQAAGAAPNG